MDKNKKEQAEKLQIKLDKLLQTREKKQQAFDKAKKELSTVTKNVDTVKLKLFEILQSGSDDTAFSNWAKRKIGESENAENPKTTKTENHANANSVNSNSAKSTNTEKPVTQNHQSQPSQNNNHTSSLTLTFFPSTMMMWVIEPSAFSSFLKFL